MRKVTFYIDDIEYFRKMFKKENPELSNRKISEILENLEPFQCVYTLFGNGKTIDHYQLTDNAGNKINFNSLNGYHRGVVLNDCMAYFTGGKFFNDDDQPCGVIRIEEGEVLDI